MRKPHSLRGRCACAFAVRLWIRAISQIGNPASSAHPFLTHRNIGYTLAAITAFAGIPSICVLYGGKDVAKSLGLSWAVAAPASVMWGLIAFSMIFGKSISTGVIGDDSIGTIDKLGGGDYSFVYYSFMYAMTALSIIIGGAGSGMKTNAFQLFMLGSLLLNYAPLAFWFWNTGALANGGACTTADTCVGAGWGWKYGIIDYSGGAFCPPSGR